MATRQPTAKASRPQPQAAPEQDLPFIPEELEDYDPDDMPFDDNPPEPDEYEFSTEPETSAEPAPEWLRTLRRPLPDGLIKTRMFEWSREPIPYVSWNAVADVLDTVVGDNWTFTVNELQLSPWDNGVVIICRATLEIHSVYRDGVGVGTASSMKMMDTAAKTAEHDALKRAAVKFGIARDLYDSPEDDHVPAHGIPGRNPAPRSPYQQQQGQQPRQSQWAVVDDAVSDAQLKFIDTLSEKLGISADEESLASYGVPSDELTKRQASDLIADLKEMAGMLDQRRR